MYDRESSGTMDVYYNIPPITRALVTATVVLSVGVHASIISFFRVVYLPQQTFWSFPPEIWRPVTSFFVTGAGLSLLLDPYFLYTYGSSLETESARFPRKEDFVWYILFNMGIIFVGHPALPSMFPLQLLRMPYYLELWLREARQDNI